MRHFRIFRPSFGLMLRMLAGVAACAVSSSCTDDTFDKYGQQGASGMLAFDVTAPSSWTDGSVTTCVADKDISIRKLTYSGGGKNLYLVTEIAEAAVDTAASNAITRGTTTTGETFKSHSFGLSAICYTGDWPEEGEENKWTTNFAHNVEVKCDGQGTWKSEKPLHWVGSENIKFFAYSPYSAAIPASSEENAIDAGDATPSIIHSATDATGIPTLTYTVPQDVTKQIDLMYATANCGGSGIGDIQNGAVQLNFKHALTAVTIKTGENMLAGKVTKIEISGVYGSGIYPIGAKEWKTADKAERTFSIDKETTLGAEKDDIMTGSDAVLNEDKDGYTFMMIPQTLPEKAKLTVVFTDEFSKTEWTLTADLKEQQWPMGSMVTYSINSTGIVVEPVVSLTIKRDGLWPDGGYNRLEDSQKLGITSLYGNEMSDGEKSAYLPVSGYLHDVEISACVQMTQAGKKTETLALPYTIEYSTDKEKWFSKLDNKDIWIPASPESFRSETGTAVKGAIRLPAQSAFEKSREKLLEAVPKGSEIAYYDLVANNPVKQESANCYLIHAPGYYKLPTVYGNTYNNIDYSKTYTYLGTFPDKNVEKHVLKNFVGHDNIRISNIQIPNVNDAIIVWQDSPDLVTDVRLENDGWVYFRIPEETINQGNAVIAVRNSAKEILWSWHIWVTHQSWARDDVQQSAAKDEGGEHFQFAPCNLGYCCPHEGNDKRQVYMRFLVTMPGGSKQILQKFGTMPQGTPQPDKDGIFTFTQPVIIKSIAGDNTYYQWGRKDPMLPGVYNAKIRSQAPSTYLEELDMENKMFYSTKEYRFTSSETGRSIGESILYPYHFFMHKRPTTDTDNNGTDDFRRRHWHDGSDAMYTMESIMNYWNSQLDRDGTVGDAFPNNMNVTKTIYDPSPAGYKMPPPSAFSKFFKKINSEYTMSDDLLYRPLKKTYSEENQIIGWSITDQEGKEFFFPSTGLRDMGIKEREVSVGTWPAHSKVTFVISAGFNSNKSNSGNRAAPMLLLIIDERNTYVTFKKQVGATHVTQNSYGITVRPILDNCMTTSGDSKPLTNRLKYDN